MSDNNKTATIPRKDQAGQGRRGFFGTVQRLVSRTRPHDEQHQTEPPAASPPPPEPSERDQSACTSLSLGKCVLGCDVGSRTLKMVLLRSMPDKIHLLDAECVDLPSSKDPDRFHRISKCIREFVRRQNPKPRTVSCIFSGNRVATVCCTMPRMDEKELRQAVEWKLAEETEGLDPDRFSIGHYTLNRSDSSNTIDVVAAAVPNSLDKLDTVFRARNGRLAAVLTEPIAIEAVVRTAYCRPDSGPVAVLDIGDRSSRLSVVGADGLEFTRNIPTGGDAVTTALAGKITLEGETIEISRLIAEQIKCHYAINQEDEVNVEGRSVPATRVLGAIRPALERLATETVRSLQFYSQTHNMAQVDHLLLCGGGATLSGLAEFLAQQTRVQTKMLDPWQALDIQVPDILESRAPAVFAAATGAAVHDPSRVNLVPDRIHLSRLISLIHNSSIAATVFVIAALCGLGWTAHRQRTSLQNSLEQRSVATAPLERIADNIAKAERYEIELEQRRALLQTLGVGRPMHSMILKELSNIMPEGTYLRRMSYETTGGLIKMRLVTDIYAMPAKSTQVLKQDLIRALETSPFFVNVSFQPAQISQDDGLTREPDEQLELSCQVIGFRGEGL